MEACRAVGPDASMAVVDVTDDAAMRVAVRQLSETGPLEVAVWAPGLLDRARADEADADTRRSVLQVNLTAPTVFTALVAPLLVSSAPSSLVFLGSQAGHQAFQALLPTWPASTARPGSPVPPSSISATGASR